MDELEDSTRGDGMLTRFNQMIIKDDETGEYWSLDEDKTILGSCNHTTPIKSCAVSCTSSGKKWRIPKEYSQLGCSPSTEKAIIQPIMQNRNSCGEKPTWPCEGETEGDKVVIANFPPAGRLPLFSRKRLCPSGKTTEKESSFMSSSMLTDDPRKKRFLEGREGLSFVGRLILAGLVLLSPGYFLPLLFTIRTYCHMWKHGLGGEAEEEIVELESSNKVFGFLRTRAFLKYSCRFCREQLRTEKMFRLHQRTNSKFKSANLPRVASVLSSVDDEDKLYCCCPNH